MATGTINLAPRAGEIATYQAAQAQASKPESVEYNASQFSVKPQATVAKQFQDLSAMDSPLLKQARARATRNVNQQMNQRGLINSSLAMGAVTEAADQAVYDKVLPIAQQDATTYFTADTNTTNAENAARYANMQAKNAALLRGSELETNVSLANADAWNKQGAQAADMAGRVQLTGLETERAYHLADKETGRALQLADKEFERAMATAQLDAQTRVQLAQMDHNTRMELANVDRATRVELATIENNYRQLLQTNQDLATMYNQVSTNIANIATSNLSPSAKQAATESQLNILRQALAAKQSVVGTPATSSTPAVSNMNISRYFTDGTVTPSGTSAPSAPSTIPKTTAPPGTWNAPGTTAPPPNPSNPSTIPPGYYVDSRGQLRPLT